MPSIELSVPKASPNPLVPVTRRARGCDDPTDPEVREVTLGSPALAYTLTIIYSKVFFCGYWFSFPLMAIASLLTHVTRP